MTPSLVTLHIICISETSQEWMSASPTAKGRERQGRSHQPQSPRCLFECSGQGQGTACLCSVPCRKPCFSAPGPNLMVSSLSPGWEPGFSRPTLLLLSPVSCLSFDTKVEKMTEACKEVWDLKETGVLEVI